MSSREVIEALRRRWPVIVVGVVLTGLFGWLTAHPQQTYKAVTVIALQPPQTPQHPNRLTDLRPSVALTAAMLTRRLKSPSGDAQLRQAGVRGGYEIAPRNSGTTQTPAYAIPSVEVSVTSADRAAALRSVQVLVTAFDDELNSLQKEWGVALTDRISVVVLAPPTALVLLPVKSRALLGSTLLGAIITVASAFWMDRYAAHRRASARTAQTNGRVARHQLSR